MPVHRVPAATLHEDLIDITRVRCERILSCVPDSTDSLFYIVLTEAGPIETCDYPDISTDFHAYRGGAR